MSGEGGAPAGGAPAAAPASTAPAADAAPAWGEKDDAELFERVSRAPWAKLKVNGKDEPIKTRADMDRVLNDAQRGRGANRVVEETKKAREEAAREKAEAARERELVKRAREGDAQARRELGLIPDDEKEAQRAQWEALPPEVRRVIERNHELETKAQERERLDAEVKQAEEAGKLKLQRDNLLKSARAHAAEILKDVKAEAYDVELPEIISAMRALTEAGQRLGVDYDAAMLGRFIEEQRGVSLDGRLTNLKPDAAVRKILPHLKSLKAADLEGILGADFDAISKVFAEATLVRYRASKKKANQQAGLVQNQKPREEPVPASRPLSPMRFGR